MKKLLIFNWKMAPDSSKEAGGLFADYLKLLKAKNCKPKAELVVAPPFVYLNQFKNLKTEKPGNLKLGAQDLFWENFGAHTGEISAKMLKNLGVEYVIIGHSERRKYLNETDKIINKKVLTALKAGLKVILCIGEGLSTRRRGKKYVERFIKNQLQKDLKGISKNYKLKANSLIIAYEPVWSIGAGHSDTPEDALEMIKFIKQTPVTGGYILNSKVLYGGSVDSKNIKNFLKYPEIDGSLIGRASLRIREIKNIINL